MTSFGKGDWLQVVDAEAPAYGGVTFPYLKGQVIYVSAVKVSVKGPCFKCRGLGRIKVEGRLWWCSHRFRPLGQGLSNSINKVKELEKA